MEPENSSDVDPAVPEEITAHERRMAWCLIWLTIGTLIFVVLIVRSVLK